MKVARLFAPHDLRVTEMPRPQPGPREVLCRVAMVGICGTDHAIYTGEASFVKSGAVHFPMTLGHEWSGTVAETGREVSRFKPGDRVTGDTMVACGSCVDCLLGKYSRCKDVRAVGTVNAWDGAYAEFILMPERHLFHLPDRISFENGAFVEPAATALNAVRKAQVQIGDTVLVQGSGPIGILAAKLAKLSGASKVFVTGRKDPKLRTALDFGADVAINTGRESIREVLGAHTRNAKVDRIIEASGSVELFGESLRLVEGGGGMSVVAFYERPMDRFDIDAFVFSEIILAAAAGSPGMYPPVLALMETGSLNAAPLITERAPLWSVTDLLPHLKENAEARIKVMLENPGA